MYMRIYMYAICICICICMCICMRVHMQQMYAYIYICMYIYIYLFIYFKWLLYDCMSLGAPIIPLPPMAGHLSDRAAQGLRNSQDHHCNKRFPCVRAPRCFVSFLQELLVQYWEILETPGIMTMMRVLCGFDVHGSMRINKHDIVERVWMSNILVECQLAPCREPK